MNKEETQDVEIVDLNMTYNGEPLTVKRRKFGALPILHEADVSYDKANDRVVLKFTAHGQNDIQVFLRPYEVNEMMESLTGLHKLLEGIEGYEWDGE